MAQTYRHGTYGEFAASISGTAVQGNTVAVYVGTAPVNLIRGYTEKKIINMPVLLSTLADAKAAVGYAHNWDSYTLCEAVKAHFDNQSGNIGPIVVINVLDPAKHTKSGGPTSQQLTITNGHAAISSDTIILDTLKIAEKTEGTDYTVDYDFTSGQVLIDSIEDKLEGTVQATYSEVDPSAVTAEEIIGGVTGAGVYSGLGAVGLVYPKLNRIPNLLLAPGWSSTPNVYMAMLSAATKINGHWDAFVLADIPLNTAETVAGRAKAGTARLTSREAVDTLEKAKAWAEKNNYTQERSKVLWPQAVGTDGRVYHLSTLTAWLIQMVDAVHNGIPMESPSNRPLPIVRQYFGTDSQNQGFDQTAGNTLNEVGITTAVFWGGTWVLWGGHTAAYRFGAVTDPRTIFDNSIRMMMYITNSFQQEQAFVIDRPMTRSMADTIRNREQEKADALVAVGALIGTPVVRFEQTANRAEDLVEGNFVWDFEATPTPQFKSGTLRVAYSAAGFASYYGEEA